MKPSDVHFALCVEQEDVRDSLNSGEWLAELAPRKPRLRGGVVEEAAKWVALQDLLGAILPKYREAARIEAIEKEFVLLKQRMLELEQMASLVVPVQTFSPEPYEITTPFHVVVNAEDDQWVATWFDANLNASGDTREEAISNLKDIIVAVFESLSGHSADRLGRGPAKQLQVLRKFIRKTA